MSPSTLKHVAIIPDGNRRWARARGLPVLEGHRRGFEQAKRLPEIAQKFGVKVLTLWAFSTENWNRTRQEILDLMYLYEQWIETYTKEALQKKIRLIHIGRKDRINTTLLHKIQKVEEMTKSFTEYSLIFALDYGGQDEIVRAVQKMWGLHTGLETITPDELTSCMDTGHLPPPDLIIRTGGEKRLSGFLLWACAYAELVFLDLHFPDFTQDIFASCIEQYHSRQRRYGR